MIGKKIKKVREELGLSQRQLAGEEMTRAYISLIENGRAIPSDKTLRIIANRLHKPTSYFLGDTIDEHVEISEAILERAKKIAQEGNIENSLKLAYKIFTLTQRLPIIVNTHLFILELKISKGLYIEALEYGDESLTDIRDLKNREVLVKYYLLMGKASFKVENYIYSKKSYKWAIKYSEQLKKLQDERIQAFMFLGTTNIRLGKIDEAISDYSTAFKEASLTGNNLISGQIMLGLGKAYYLKREHTKSLEYTNKAIVLLDSYSKEKVYALHNKAVINCKIGNLQESLIILEECLELYEELGLKQKQASILEELAKISLDNGDIHSSKDFCDRAIKLLEYEDDGIIRAKLYRILGLIYHEEKQFDQSYYFLRMSYDLLIRLNATSEAAESLRLIKKK